MPMRVVRAAKRHSVAILFVIFIVGGFLSYQRQENLIINNRELGEQNKALTLQIAKQAAEQQAALCDSRVEARTDLKNLLLGMVDDFIPVGRPARYELERRINEALGPPPEDCT